MLLKKITALFVISLKIIGVIGLLLLPLWMVGAALQIYDHGPCVILQPLSDSAWGLKHSYEGILFWVVLPCIGLAGLTMEVLRRRRQRKK